MAGTKTLQKMIALYRNKSGETELDARKIAEFAVKNGVELPEPVDPLDALAKSISRAAREEVRKDDKTQRPYRAYHSFTVQQGNDTLHLWVDIDDATRPQMQRSVTGRREHMVGEAVQLTFDVDHWNDANPDLEPIIVPVDFGPDVEWRKAADEPAPEPEED